MIVKLKETRGIAISLSGSRTVIGIEADEFAY
jgi:hypothetical protein